MPICVADWLRELTRIAGAVTLVMLCLLLWQGAAVAACPHDGSGASSAATAQHHVESVAKPDHVRSAPLQSQGPGQQKSGPHGALQPCCGGMACAAMAVAAPGGELMAPVELAGSIQGWPAGPLREGQEVRPALPPPRLG